MRYRWSRKPLALFYFFDFLECTPHRLYPKEPALRRDRSAEPARRPHRGATWLLGAAASLQKSQTRSAIQATVSPLFTGPAHDSQRCDWGHRLRAYASSLRR